METEEEASGKEKTTATFDSQALNSGIQVRSVVLFLAATLTTAVLVEYLSYYRGTLFNGKLEPQATNESLVNNNPQPTYAIFNRHAEEDHLVHVKQILHRLGYKRMDIDANWDLLWAHDYPYRVMQNLKNLEAHQWVNHFPGCGHITNKVDLCTTRMPFLPPAFRLPAQKDEFLAYAQANPDKLFVEKHNEHRHIKVRAPSDIDLRSNDSFVQEFIQKPFLVDGHKFDIGVYVVITSVNPLRVYIYSGDVLFRYCPVKYYPFDADNQDKYIVGDDYLPTWEVPSLRKYYNKFGGSMRTAFEAYVRDQSLDPAKIWPQVEHIIRNTILNKENEITDLLRGYRTHNFFELMRFDLFIDEQLNVMLMEANMSPNLSSAHFKPNALLYKQVLYSVLHLVSIPSFNSESRKLDAEENDETVTADKNLATGLNKCAANSCDKSCNKEECRLCLPCLSGSEYELLQRTHREHLHRVDMKRIFPKPIEVFESYDIEVETRSLSSKNAWISHWFYEKCLFDRTWCT